MRNRHVQVNGNLCRDDARRLKSGDVVKLASQPMQAPITANDIQFHYLDEHLAILEKPAGITTTRHKREASLSKRRRQLQPTLEELANQQLQNELYPSSRSSLFSPEKSFSPENHGRRSGRFHGKKGKKQQLFAVHRLDRDTSGLMLMARNANCRQSLTTMFREHRVDRRYLAVVHGHPASQTIQTYIAKDRGDGKRGSIAISSNDPRLRDPRSQIRLAITHFRNLKSYGSFSLIECKLETGRTHQIRIHLSEIGHPLAGERLYIQTTTAAVAGADKRGAISPIAEPPRHVLHSHAIRFVHPITKQTVSVRSEWPKDLETWFNDLTSQSIVTDSQ